MTDEPIEQLHFALIADTISSGLEEQIERFISEHPNTKIIFIDTLQKIRSDSPDSTYATDYKELSVLKSIADKNSIAIVLVQNAYELAGSGIKFSSERSHGARRIRLDLLSGDGRFAPCPPICARVDRQVE